MSGLLRPLPFRGDLIAAGGVVLAVGVLVLVGRMQWAPSDPWPPVVLMLASGLTATFLLTLGWRAPVEGPAPRAYVSALLLAPALLVEHALGALADALGGDPNASGSALWTGLVFAGLYGGLAWARASAACALLAGVSVIFTLASAVAWTSEPVDVTALRWAYCVAIAGLAGAAMAVHGLMPRHAQALAVAAGVAAVALYGAVGGFGAGYLPFGGGEQLVLADGGSVEFVQPPQPSTAWDVVVLAAGAGLLLFAFAERRRGARGVAWAGALVLAAFAALAADAGSSLLWWPLVLAVAGAGGVTAGFALRRDEVTTGGGIALGLAIAVTVARFDGEWAAGVLALLAAAGAAFLLVLGLRTSRDEGERLPADALLVASFPLAAGGLLELAVALGGGLTSPGTIAWVALALAVGYGALAAVRGSGALALFAALAGVGALVAAVLWLFEPDSPAPLRWVLLVAIVALGVAAVRLRDRRHPQAVGLAVVAGFVAVALVWLLQTVVGLRFAEADGSVPYEGPAAGWELLLLGVGFALCAFGAVDRANGPAWIGAAVLYWFGILATGPGDDSALWWPVLLIALGGGVVAAGLRPTTPMPPPPDADAPFAPPTPIRPSEPPA